MNNILKWMAPALCVVLLSSCLKNKNEQPDFSSVTPVLEIPVASPTGNGGGNSITLTYVTPLNATEDYTFYVNYAAPDANASAIPVTLTVDPTALAKWNTTNGSSVPILASSNYSAPTSVTIPAGQRKMTVPIKINTGALALGTYALPFTISNGAGIVVSKNFASLILKIVVKDPDPVK